MSEKSRSQQWTSNLLAWKTGKTGFLLTEKNVRGVGLLEVRGLDVLISDMSAHATGLSCFTVNSHFLPEVGG